MFVVIVFTFSLNKIWTFKGEEFHSNTLYQFFQFVIIGILGFAIYSGLMMGLHGTLNWNEYLAMVIAYYSGLVNNFFWNEIWTFNPKLIDKMKARRNKTTETEVSESN
jgi:putative flippase GtrA